MILATRSSTLIVMKVVGVALLTGLLSVSNLVGQESLRIQPTAEGFVISFPTAGLAKIAGSLDGNYVALAKNFWSPQAHANQTELTYFDLKAGKILWTTTYSNPNCCLPPVVQVSHNGRFVLSGGQQVHLFNREGAKLKSFAFQDSKEFALSATLDDDGQTVAAASTQRAYLFRLNSGMVASWPEEWAAVALSGDGQSLLIVTNAAAKLYNAPQATLAEQKPLTYQGTLVQAAISADGKVYVAAGQPKHAEPSLLTDVFMAGSPQKKQLALANVKIPQLAVDRGGRFVTVEGALGDQAALWATGTDFSRTFSTTSEPAHIALTAVGNRVAIAKGPAIELRSLPDDKLLQQMNAASTVQSLFLSENWLMALSNDKSEAMPNRILAWKVQTK
ncbi:hypothetical protein HYR54_08140 [Candidatus Acetothermia bacterium]|nr:hypothetical protein [Candidatus Acetothermia bacterium]